MASVLAEFGFAGRSMFVAELGHRLMGKSLPASPVTRDAADLFALVFHDPRDATWIQALAPAQVHAAQRVGGMVCEHLDEHGVSVEVV